ncbi:MAG: hypothetical protein GY913_11195 [Proteobacteria bacterium]|nr:hypothetical protein [Pseudomonadota bacterium]MCP4917479.1 hypothetical protein [Pseudomonadota bacterium]
MLLLIVACFPEPEYYDTGFEDDCLADVEVARTGFDLGVQAHGAEAWDFMELHSTGCRPLIIEDAWSDLDSVEVTHDADPIPVDGFGTLYITWKQGDSEGDFEGEFGRVYVQTNARELPLDFTFRVEAE